MFGFGMPELISVGVVIVFVTFFSALRRKGDIQVSGPTLVLRHFAINRNIQANTSEVISIAGRVSGLIAWFYTVIGIDAETTMAVTGGELRFKSSSLFGEQHHVIPMQNISSVHCGYVKPITYLFISGFFLLAALFALINKQWTMFFFALLVTGIFGLLYWLLKKINITVNTKGGAWFGLSFKRSIIENVPVDIEQAKLAIAIINNMAISSHGSTSDVSKVLADSLRHVELANKQSQDGRCVHCGQSMEKGAKFCTSCGRSV